ncbi:MAG: prohead protease/major capsid protein fusion protein [Allorhizobium sp.]
MTTRNDQRLATIYREATIQRAEIEGDEANVTFVAVYSTGAAVRRWDWDVGYFNEELSIDPAHIRRDRLATGSLPILLDHHQSVRNTFGVVERDWIEGGKAYVQFRMEHGTPEADAILNKLRQGIVKNVSVGYRVYAFIEDQSSPDKIPTLRAIDWEPMEISLVSVPADAGAVVRKDGDPAAYPCKIIRSQDTSTGETPMTTAVAANTTAPVADPSVTENRAAPAQAPGIDTRAITQAIEAERIRSSSIRSLCRQHGIDDATTDQLITEGKSFDEAGRAVLDALAARTASTATNPTIRVGHSYDDPTVVRAAIVDSLAAKTGGNIRVEGKALAFMGRSMVESYAELLAARGERVTYSKEWLADRALHTTSDFPVMLADAMHRVVQSDYAAAPSTFKLIARQNNFSDFRDHEFLRGSEFPALKDLGEGGEIQSASIDDAKTEVARLNTKAIMIAVTRNLLINDQTGYLSQHFAKVGRRLAAQENQVAWDLVKANPKMKWDGKSVFHADHGNLHGSAAASPDVAILSAIRAQLRKHTSDGIPLNFALKYLIIDPDLETDVEKLATSIMATVTGDVNPFSGKFQPIVEPNLSSHNAWYGATDPADAEVLTYGYLNGATGPMVDTKPGWDRLGSELRIVHDFGVGIIGEKGIYKVRKS